MWDSRFVLEGIKPKKSFVCVCVAALAVSVLWHCINPTPCALELVVILSTESGQHSVTPSHRTRSALVSGAAEPHALLNQCSQPCFTESLPQYHLGISDSRCKWDMKSAVSVMRVCASVAGKKFNRPVENQKTEKINKSRKAFQYELLNVSKCWPWHTHTHTHPHSESETRTTAKMTSVQPRVTSSCSLINKKWNPILKGWYSNLTTFWSCTQNLNGWVPACVLCVRRFVSGISLMTDDTWFWIL